MKANQSINRLTAGQSFLLDALGDSLTSGWMVQKGYLDFLNDMLKEVYPKADIQLNNHGLPGDTARGGLFRLQRQVIKSQPDAFIIQFGVNDLDSDISADDYKSNVQFRINYRVLLIKCNSRGCNAMIMMMIFPSKI